MTSAGTNGSLTLLPHQRGNTGKKPAIPFFSESTASNQFLSTNTQEILIFQVHTLSTTLKYRTSTTTVNELIKGSQWVCLVCCESPQWFIITPSGCTGCSRSYKLSRFFLLLRGSGDASHLLCEAKDQLDFTQLNTKGQSSAKLHGWSALTKPHISAYPRLQASKMPCSIL